jgi:hypothetical protein
MTARDAAHLLVAVLGSGHVKDAAETVRRHRQTLFHKSASGGYGDSSITALRDLPLDHSFVDAIEALIAAGADGSLERAMYDSRAEMSGFAPIIEITVKTPGEVGYISIRGGDATGHGRYGPPGPLDHYQKSRLTAGEVDAWNQKFRDTTRKAILPNIDRLRLKLLWS